METQHRPPTFAATLRAHRGCLSVAIKVSRRDPMNSRGLHFLFALVWISACGRSSELQTNESHLFYSAAESHLGDSPLADAAVQNEVRTVSTQLSEGLMAYFVPEYTAL